MGNDASPRMVFQSYACMLQQVSMVWNYLLNFTIGSVCRRNHVHVHALHHQDGFPSILPSLCHQDLPKTSMGNNRLERGDESGNHSLVLLSVSAIGCILQQSKSPKCQVCQGHIPRVHSSKLRK